MTKLPNFRELELSELTAIFRETRNPAAAWLAFHLATKHKLPVPKIVAGEIERFAADVSKPLLAAWEGSSRAKILDKCILKAWGLKRGTKLAQNLRLARRSVNIVGDYWAKITSNTKPTAAIAALVKKYHVSEKTIESILTAARKKRDPSTPKF